MALPETFTVGSRPSAGEARFLEDSINAFNVARTGLDDGRLLSIFVRDAAPGFYQKLGYQAAGAFNAYPRGYQ